MTSRRADDPPRLDEREGLPQGSDHFLDKRPYCFIGVRTRSIQEARMDSLAYL